MGIRLTGRCCSAFLWCEIDEFVGTLGQLCDGDPPPLPDELGHRLQLLFRDEDELSAVVDHATQ